MTDKRTEFAQWVAQPPEDAPHLHFVTKVSQLPPLAPIPLDAGQKDRLAALREMRELGHGVSDD